MTKSNPEPKVALVHDFLTSLGGAERVLMALHEMYPDAPIYTLAYDRAKTHWLFNGVDIREAKLAKSLIGRSRKLSLAFLPNAIDTLPLQDYDLVISSSSAFSKGVITRPETLHICYCHTPMRYAWDWTHEYAIENGFDRGAKSYFYRLIMHYLRLWDRSSAERVDVWIANSKNVATRIHKYYRKEATVIYPPVETEYDRKMSKNYEQEPYFFIVSRLSPYKKIDLAIEACGRLNQKLIIIGDGPDRRRLEQLAKTLGANVEFLGFQTDYAIHRYYEECRAFIFAGEDDLGITPIEAMAHGKPVIAYAKGGVLETVIDKHTGVLFIELSVASLAEALRTFIKKEGSFKPEVLKQHAKQFSKDAFRNHMRTLIAEEWAKHQKKLT